ncbi:AhpD-like protein [Dactylonectria macrodidyma]|uniref:AhpD-like protein n=1 Tax=Dactylonectria macrodidyma TaxID=307937 RepID=A0A9P9F4R6_9HYPO|nr:AhpD-like protein [Dactylonectria macrodidyma]
MSQPSEKLLLGAQMTQKFLGEEMLERIQETSRNDLPAQVGAEYIAEVCFSSYARPELQFKERSLMNIAMMIALNRGPELRIHIEAGLRNGLTQEQICEACRHAMIYCGVPAGRDALAAASDIFAAVEARGKQGNSARLA